MRNFKGDSHVSMVAESSGYSRDATEPDIKILPVSRPKLLFSVGGNLLHDDTGNIEIAFGIPSLCTCVFSQTEVFLVLWSTLSLSQLFPTSPIIYTLIIIIINIIHSSSENHLKRWFWFLKPYYEVTHCSTCSRRKYFRFGSRHCRFCATSMMWN